MKHMFKIIFVVGFVLALSTSAYALPSLSIGPGGDTPSPIAGEIPGGSNDNNFVGSGFFGSTKAVGKIKFPKKNKVFNNRVYPPPIFRYPGNRSIMFSIRCIAFWVNLIPFSYVPVTNFTNGFRPLYVMVLAKPNAFSMVSNNWPFQWFSSTPQTLSTGLYLL